MMSRDKVEHILRAAGGVTGKTEFVLIGSAAVSAWRANLPDAMVISRDVDLFAYDAPDAEEIADLLDGALGQASQFDSTWGYYCDGVGPNTAMLPNDWETRAMRFTSPATEGVVAIVPEPSDIALSKLAAGRPKDMAWLRAAVGHGVIDVAAMEARLPLLPSHAPPADLLQTRLRALRGPAA